MKALKVRNYEWKQIESVSQDFDYHRNEALIRSLIRGGGSTSETIFCAFVLDDLSKLSGHYKDIQEAWERLDATQHAALIQCRRLTTRQHLANAKDSLINCLERLIDDLVIDETKEEYLWCLPFDTQRSLCEKALEHYNEMGITYRGKKLEFWDWFQQYEHTEEIY